MATDTKYQAIVWWGRHLGSYDHYINEQVAKAEAEGAPETAIYYHPDIEGWRTIEDVSNFTVLQHMAASPREIYGTVPQKAAKRLAEMLAEEEKQ